MSHRLQLHPILRLVTAIVLLLATGLTVYQAPPVAAQGCTTSPCTFEPTGALQTFTVPAGVTRLTIRAVGAAGGFNRIFRPNGGSGASLQGDFAVTPGEQLTILVGGRGATGPTSGGGGGGSFVWRGTGPITPQNVLLAAGGGGGAGAATVGGDAVLTPNGAPGAGTLGGAGGTMGGGGAAGTNAAGEAAGGGGGAGIIGSGTPAGRGGTAINLGGAGRAGGGGGGFGGGGGAVGQGSGGGNGGGGGGSRGGLPASTPGGGGGSFNGGANQVNTAGVGTGDGQVVITAGIAPPPSGVPHTVSRCRDGGYRNFIDPATGQPFRNQGECIRFVRQHFPNQNQD